MTTRNNGCYLLRPHRPRDRRPQGGRPPHLRARGLLRPPHPVRLLRQGFRPPRVRIPVIPSRGFRAEFFPWFIGRTSDRRARVLAHRAPAPTGFDAAASQEPFVDDIERALAPGRVSRGARPGGAVARDSRSLGLRACPPVDRAQGATGGGVLARAHAAHRRAPFGHPQHLVRTPRPVPSRRSRAGSPAARPTPARVTSLAPDRTRATSSWLLKRPYRSEI